MRNRMRACELSLIVVVALVPVTGHAGKQVSVCHVPPGNPTNVHTISIGEAAISAHLAHGDEPAKRNAE